MGTNTACSSVAIKLTVTSPRSDRKFAALLSNVWVTHVDARSRKLVVVGIYSNGKTSKIIFRRSLAKQSVWQSE